MVAQARSRHPPGLRGKLQAVRLVIVFGGGCQLEHDVEKTVAFGPQEVPLRLQVALVR